MDGTQMDGTRGRRYRRGPALLLLLLLAVAVASIATGRRQTPTVLAQDGVGPGVSEWCRGTVCHVDGEGKEQCEYICWNYKGPEPHEEVPPWAHRGCTVSWGGVVYESECLWWMTDGSPSPVQPWGEVYLVWLPMVSK